jgi:hypothetical protein
MKQFQRLLREPLVHFLAIGGLLYALYPASEVSGGHEDDSIEITPQRIEQITAGFNKVWRRSPTPQELDALVDEEIRTEVYYRDALALGLDKNDPMVRRRMRQKMEFLTDTAVYLKKPEKGELERYFANNAKLYQSAPRLAFEQLFVGKNAQGKNIERALQALNSGDTSTLPSLIQPSRLPAQMKLAREEAIESVFGNGFFAHISNLPRGVWSGPVTSSYGVHLVRTLGDSPASMPPLDEVRETVLRAWRAEQIKQFREQDYAERKQRYSIAIMRDNGDDQ